MPAGRVDDVNVCTAAPASGNSDGRSGGMRRVLQLDAATAGLLGVCDGSLTARAALTAIAELLGESPADTIAAALPMLRALVADGFVAA